MGRVGGVLDRLDNVQVERRPLLKGLVQCDLAQFAAHGCLRELHNCKVGVLHPIRRPHGVNHLHSGHIASGSLAYIEEHMKLAQVLLSVDAEAQVKLHVEVVWACKLHCRGQFTTCKPLRKYQVCIRYHVSV